ncbi:MAG: tRNA (guanosine(46)-N7)-methyltransferase TrmB [Gammaproteobacteria bacterium]
MVQEVVLTRRPIRSFVRREGRLTPGQQRALDRLWPRYGIDYSEALLDLDAVFGRSATHILEIGFGNGESLAEIAANHPAQDFIGIEVHRPGVGHLLRELEARDLDNVRVITHDAVEVLKAQIPDAALDAVYLFFPDPWPKKRHHKRRIVQPEFVQLLRRKLKVGGVFHLATDWENYAEHMLEVMRGAEGFRNRAADNAYSPRPDYRPVTKFEQRGQRLGHGVWDLLFERVA